MRHPSALTYHVQADPFRSLCGRRLGIPGGSIYPGVWGKPALWFLTHRYPDLIREATCKKCQAQLAARLEKLKEAA